MSNTFVVSDLHVSHRNIISLCNRPFSSVEEMDDYLIDRWNSVVKPGDLVYNLGDFCWYNCDFESLLRKLNGQQILIKGNHDSKKVQKCHLWTAVKSDVNITINKTHIHMYHYPIQFRQWNKGFHDGIHFHGHVHGTLPYTPGCWDVGIDYKTNIELYDRAPIPIEDAIDLAYMASVEKETQ